MHGAETRLRIAACLSGPGGTAAYCAPYLQRFFRGHRVDYFIHAWPDDAAHVALYEPKAVSRAVPADLQAKERRVAETFRDGSFLDRIRLYWGMSEAIRLVPDSGYDLVVRVRPDLVPLQRLNFTLSSFDPGAVYFSYHMQQPMRSWQSPPMSSVLLDKSLVGYHDGLFFGAPDVMRHFGSAYDLIDAFCEADLGLRFTPAVYLHFLIAAGVPQPLRAPISYHLIDEFNAGRALSLFEFRGEREGQESAVWSHTSSLPLSSAEQFFESGWSGEPRNAASPSVSPSIRRLMARRYQKAL